MCGDSVRWIHLDFVQTFNLNVAFATASLAHFNAPWYVRSLANFIMVLFIRYCCVNVTVASGESKRANRLWSAPNCLQFAWLIKRNNYDYNFSKRVHENTNDFQSYFATVDRVIGGNWSGSPTSMIFLAENSGRKIVLWNTCVDSSTKQMSNVRCVSNGWPDPKHVTPTTFFKIENLRGNLWFAT